MEEMNNIKLPYACKNLHSNEELCYALLRNTCGRIFDFNLYPTHEEWLAARKPTIGASEAGTILGLTDSMRTRQQLFDEKTGKEDNHFVGNELTQLGQQCEPLMRALWALEHPQYEVYDPTNIIFTSKRRPWQSCSLDMVVLDREKERWYVGEFKTGIYNDKWKGSYCPDAYFAQLLHQLCVTGFHGAFLHARLRPAETDLSSRITEKDYYYEHNMDLLDQIRALLNEEKKFYNDIREKKLTPKIRLEF